MLTKSMSQLNWTRIKSKILLKWPRLDKEELDLTFGNLKQIRRLIISRYGNNGKILKELNSIHQAAVLHNENFDEDMEATMLNPSFEKLSFHDFKMSDR